MTEITERHAARLAVAAIRRAGQVDFTLRPGAAWRDGLAADLTLSDLRKLTLTGRAEAAGRDVGLTARLGATVTQPCIVSLRPVTTRIEADITRLYVEDFEMPQADEAEMPEDDSREALAAQIDLEALLAEALALNLPLYPRAEGAEYGGAGDDAAPDGDETEQPFAGLSALRDRLDQSGGD